MIVSDKGEESRLLSPSGRHSSQIRKEAESGKSYMLDLCLKARLMIWSSARSFGRWMSSEYIFPIARKGFVESQYLNYTKDINRSIKQIGIDFRESANGA